MFITDILVPLTRQFKLFSDHHLAHYCSNQGKTPQGRRRLPYENVGDARHLAYGCISRTLVSQDVEDQLPQWLVLAIKVSFWAAIKEVIKALSHFQWYHLEVK